MRGFSGSYIPGGPIVGEVKFNEKIPYGCYLKSETYNKEEINALVGSTVGLPSVQIATNQDIDLLMSEGSETPNTSQT